MNNLEIKCKKYEKNDFSTKLLKNGFLTKCQIARKAWFWHVASQIIKTQPE